MLSLRLQAPKTVYLGGKGALQPIAHLSEGGIAYIPSYDVRYKIVSAEPDDVITYYSADKQTDYGLPRSLNLSPGS
jgi:hypothetical protein